MSKFETLKESYKDADEIEEVKLLRLAYERIRSLEPQGYFVVQIVQYGGDMLLLEEKFKDGTHYNKYKSANARYSELKEKRDFEQEDEYKTYEDVMENKKLEDFGRLR